MKILFPGSFDPFTNAHLEIVKRLIKLDYHVVVGIFVNAQKDSFFTPQEKIEIIKLALEENKLDNIEIFCSEDLLVNECKKRNIKIVARGIRSIKDYEYEKEMEYNNKQVDKNLEYIYLNSSQKNNYVSSTIVRELISHQEKFTYLTPSSVEIILKRRKK